MNNLYPLKFTPICKDKIWGGNKLHDLLNKEFPELPNCGESWEISGVQDDISVVSNGFLTGNSLEELIEVYMGDLVGEKVYEKFGTEFPLLVSLSMPTTISQSRCIPMMNWLLKGMIPLAKPRCGMLCRLIPDPG